MSNVLEILGRAIDIPVANIIWNWFNAVGQKNPDSPILKKIEPIIELAGKIEYAKAREILSIHLYEFPDCVYGNMASAALALENNEIDLARRDLEKICRTNPSNTMALYALGHCYEISGSTSKAIQVYQDCLKFKSYLQLPAQRLAAIYLKEAEFSKALDLYRLLNDEYPGQPALQIPVGMLYLINNMPERAAESFDSAIIGSPDTLIQDTATEDDQFLSNEQIEQDLAQLQQHLTENPKDNDAVVSYAKMIESAGHLDQAIDCYQYALEINPGSLEISIKIGSLYYEKQHYHLAAQQFNAAAEVNDMIVDAYIGLSISQKKLDRHDQALRTLDLAAAIQPNTTFLFSQAAILQFKSCLDSNYLMCDMDNQALLDQLTNAYRSQIFNDSQNPDLLYRLAMLLMAAGESSQAIEYLKQALEINPAFDRARTKLAICLFNVGRETQAMDILTIAAVLDRQTLDLHYKTALLYCDKFKFAASLMNLENSMHSNLAQSNPAANISIILENLGLIDRTATRWESISATTDLIINQIRQSI